MRSSRWWGVDGGVMGAMKPSRSWAPSYIGLEEGADRIRPCHPLLTQCRVRSLFFVPRLDPARRQIFMATMTTATATVSDARVSKLARLPLFGGLPDTSPWRYYWVTSACHKSISGALAVERCVHSVFENYLIPAVLIFTSTGFLD